MRQRLRCGSDAEPIQFAKRCLNGDIALTLASGWNRLAVGSRGASLEKPLQRFRRCVPPPAEQERFQLLILDAPSPPSHDRGDVRPVRDHLRYVTNRDESLTACVNHFSILMLTMRSFASQCLIRSKTRVIVPPSWNSEKIFGRIGNNRRDDPNS